MTEPRGTNTATTNEERERLRDQKFGRIHAWLKEDFAKWRLSTSRVSHGRWLPPRLLDLEVAAAEEDEKVTDFDPERLVRLINTKDAKFVKLPNGMMWPPYATLSHRWGDDLAMKRSRTLTSNIEARYSQGIKISELCKTF